METQLTLLEAKPTWRLDERTREVGRRGVAEARAILRAGGEQHQPEPPAAESRRARQADGRRSRPAA